MRYARGAPQWSTGQPPVTSTLVKSHDDIDINSLLTPINGYQCGYVYTRASERSVHRRPLSRSVKPRMQRQTGETDMTRTTDSLHTTRTRSESERTDDSFVCVAANASHRLDSASQSKYV